MLRKVQISAFAALTLLAAAKIGFAQMVAFPGAVGQGALSTGGRGGDVYHVTNLLDYKSNQPAIVGSLRHAIATATGPRTIVFDVGGSLRLSRPLSINKDKLTLAGQTSPSGITVWGYPTSISGAEDVMVRHMRFRTGDFNVMTANPDGSPTNPVGGNGNMDLLGDSADGINVTNGSNRIILDHVSASWSLDETLSVTVSKNVTVQNSMITASLNSSLHHKGEHGYGSLVRGEVTAAEQANGEAGFTFYGNLWAHHDARNPSFGGQQTLEAGQAEANRRRINVNLVNSVIFDWAGNATHRNNDGDVYANIVNNYYVNGPMSSSARFFSASGPGSTYVYQQGNYHDRDRDVDHDGFLVDTPSEIAAAFVNFEAGDVLNSTGGGAPYNFYSWVTDAVVPATLAYDRVMQSAGASLWRDAIDQHTLGEVASRTGGIINSQEVYRNGQGVLPGIDDLPTIWRSSQWDTDLDGMSDAFEIDHGLDPNDAGDRNQTTLSPLGYTNLEVYLDAAAAGEFIHIALAGDFNGDLVVDALDYVVWRNNFGDVNEADVYHNGDGLNGVDEADFDLWKLSYGNTLPPGSGGLGAVPEPASAALLLFVAAFFACGRTVCVKRAVVRFARPE